MERESSFTTKGYVNLDLPVLCFFQIPTDFKPTVFPGNAASSVRLGYENRNEQIAPTFGGSLNPETWYNSFQQHNLNSFGRRPFDDDGNGDGLYWIWNSMDGSSADFL